jgi:hypothetical protein
LNGFLLDAKVTEEMGDLMKARLKLISPKKAFLCLFSDGREIRQHLVGEMEI